MNFRADIVVISACPACAALRVKVRLSWILAWHRSTITQSIFYFILPHFVRGGEERCHYGRARSRAHTYTC